MSIAEDIGYHIVRSSCAAELESWISYAKHQCVKKNNTGAFRSKKLLFADNSTMLWWIPEDKTEINRVKIRVMNPNQDRTWRRIFAEDVISK